MKVLFLSNRVPFPPNDGGSVGVYQAAMGLVEQGIEVDFFSLNPSRNYIDISKAHELKKMHHYEVYNINTDITVIGALKNLLYNTSYHITRFFDKKIDEKLIALLQKSKYDIIHFDGLQMTVYHNTVRQFSTGKCVMRAANVEHQIWEKLAANTSQPQKKWYLKTAATQLEKYEIETIKKLDGLMTVSNEDAEFFKQCGYQKAIHINYTGYNASKLPSPVQVQNCVYHIGSMDWMPNIEGMRWFMKEVWPQVHQQLPQITLHLAGKNMGDEFYTFEHLNVKNHGQVTDAYEFVNDKSILIIPLFSGSGMRVKTVEAMAMGKTIIGTPLAAQGLPEEVKKYMIIVQTPEQFAEKIIYFYQHPEQAQALGEQARQYAEKHFEIKQINQEVVKYYYSLI